VFGKMNDMHFAMMGQESTGCLEAKQAAADYNGARAFASPAQ
jgi:hypothetical protein